MKYSYIETDNGYHIIREGKDISKCITTVDEKRSAELIVSELNTIYRSVHKTVSNAKLKVQAQE